MFGIARVYERNSKPELALALYLECTYPGARLRAIRTLENLGRFGEAQQIAQAAAGAPESEAEAQRLPRVLRRLARRNKAPLPDSADGAPPPRIDLIVPHPPLARPVEILVAELLATEHAPVYYVENTLIKALFGLLFWDAIFAPIVGAFFHPFHTGPADLCSPDFSKKRSKFLAEGFARLDSAEYLSLIKNTFRAKHGIQSPFVSWRHLPMSLVEMALECIPALDLRRCFERLLSNLHENRNGLPDLIQFWPQEKRYRMIEVKGPGDRLQDNQRRWLRFCLDHEMPVAVCHVRWS
jgi:hypothetical protein